MTWRVRASVQSCVKEIACDDQKNKLLKLPISIYIVEFMKAFPSQQGDDSVSNRRYSVDFDTDDELEEEVYRYRRPRQAEAEHRVRKMRQEREEGNRKRQERRRIEH